MYRNPFTNAAGEVLVESLSANIDDRTIHELYLWPFQDAVMAGAANVMCGYQSINNSHACQNSKALNGLLKEELGFQGFVVTDWAAQHGGVASANAGLDMAMPNSIAFWDSNATGLVAMVANGSVAQSRLDDMATRIIASWYFLHQDALIPEPGNGLPVDPSLTYVAVDARDPASKSTLLTGAIEGHVLAKNVNNALPLNSPKLLSLYGYDATVPNRYNPGRGAASGANLGVAQWNFGYESALTINFTALFELSPGDRPFPATARNGTLWVGGGSGANTPSYISAPFEAISQQAYEDNTGMFITPRQGRTTNNDSSVLGF